MKYKKKLIEVALPLEAINIASAREKSMRHGHPSTLHLWWARRPLAAARAVIFSQMVDDPSEHPDIFKTEKAQEKERLRLFKIIEDLVKWENSTNEEVLQKARDEIWQSWRYTCAENADQPNADILFDRKILPALHDPFAGGGAIPLEAQRLGLESYASDLNPVAVLINKAMIEIPSSFFGMPPINPDSQNRKSKMDLSWDHVEGLAEDVGYYGKWMLEQAFAKIGSFYPEIEVTAEMAINRPELDKYVGGEKLTPIAWLWARTVKSPNPAFSGIDVPLVSSFFLSTKAGKEAYVVPVIDGGGYHFSVKDGLPGDIESVKSGTKLARGANFKCLLSDTPISGDYIKSEGKAGRMSTRLLAIVAEGNKGRVYLAPTPEQEAAALVGESEWKPDLTISGSTQYLGVKPYGMEKFHQLFTNRQLKMLNVFSDLVADARSKVFADLVNVTSKSNSGWKVPAEKASSYADAIATYLAFLVDQVANHSSSVCGWNTANAQMRSVFARQAIPMTWDFAESNPFSTSSGSFANLFERQVKGFAALGFPTQGSAIQADANTQQISANKVVSTDPPYYDNIPYADLSDFFYVWLRRSLQKIYPDLFSTMAVPKAEELVAFAYRHKDKSGAEEFFLNGMTEAMHRLSEQAHPAFPVTIYYAFKQSENDGAEGTASTGWETFVDAVIRAGFATTGTWPMRTEKPGRVRENEANALASSIILVCRKRLDTAPTATRRELLSALRAELPLALLHLQAGNIAPVDLAQAAIGPGMGIFTRYSKVLDADGQPLTVRNALSLINQILDETLAEQGGNFDVDTKWALTWFEQFGFTEGDYGIAEQLSTSKNTSVAGLVEGGILISGAGRARLLKPAELKVNWDPLKDKRLTAWETVHQLIKSLDEGGELSAAILVQKLGPEAEVARELCYRLYTICERKKRANDAMAYNALVQSWPEITRLATEAAKPPLQTTDDLFS